MYADTHIHLCPGLDDGPRTLDDALQILGDAVRLAAKAPPSSPLILAVLTEGSAA